MAGRRERDLLAALSLVFVTVTVAFEIPDGPHVTLLQVGASNSAGSYCCPAGVDAAVCRLPLTNQTPLFSALC